VFKQLTGLGKRRELRLLQAPFTLHAHVLAAIRARGRARARGTARRMIAKMNALLDPSVIEALYEPRRPASRST
jgi:polyphosphate kinase